MTRHEKVLAHMDEYVDEFLRLEPREDYDPCIVGVARRFNDTVLIYSIRSIIDMHMRHGMTYDEASEWFEYNTIGGWYGEQTPIFLDDLIDLHGTLVEEENTTEMT